MTDATAVTGHDFLQHCLLFDIEVNERNTIYSIGAVLNGKTLQIAPGRPIDRKQLDELDRFAKDADFLLGHIYSVMISRD